jgi:hypothetical protein
VLACSAQTGRAWTSVGAVTRHRATLDTSGSSRPSAGPAGPVDVNDGPRPAHGPAARRPRGPLDDPAAGGGGPRGAPRLPALPTGAGA